MKRPGSQHDLVIQRFIKQNGEPPEHLFNNRERARFTKIANDWFGYEVKNVESISLQETAIK